MPALSGSKLIGGENMLSARNGCAGVTSGSALGFIGTSGCGGCAERSGCNCNEGCSCERNTCGTCERSTCGTCERSSCGTCERNTCGCGEWNSCGCGSNWRNGCRSDGWGNWNRGSCFARSLFAQLHSLHNTRVHITTFTCTLDVVLLDICDEFIRVLDYSTGKIFLLRVDCICMIEQPIVPGCCCN